MVGRTGGLSLRVLPHPGGHQPFTVLAYESAGSAEPSPAHGPRPTASARLGDTWLKAVWAESNVDTNPNSALFCAESTRAKLSSGCPACSVVPENWRPRRASPIPAPWTRSSAFCKNRLIASNNGEAGLVGQPSRLPQRASRPRASTRARGLGRHAGRLPHYRKGRTFSVTPAS